MLDFVLVFGLPAIVVWSLCLFARWYWNRRGVVTVDWNPKYCCKEHGIFSLKEAISLGLTYSGGGHGCPICRKEPQLVEDSGEQ